MTNEQFIYAIEPHIQKYCRQYGYRFPSAIIAQACLESGYGRSELAAKHHNYFGMKCGTSWRGKSVNMKTKEEYTAGQTTVIRDNFRAYDSMEQGIKGYFDFIKMERYARLMFADSSRNYLERIKDYGYATSSNYVANVYSVVTKYNLLKYDIAPKKEQDEKTECIAKQVIKGIWGNGTERKRRLLEAGHNYDVIQKRVNELLKG